MNRTLVFRSTYYDSVTMMLAAQNALEDTDVDDAFAFMATPINIELARRQGVELEDGLGPDDLVIAARGASEDAVERALNLIQAKLRERGSHESEGTASPAPRSITAAVRGHPDSQLALISVPGDVAAYECAQALERGLHVFCFSDRVPKASEIALKQLATKKGLLLMGPDCGTSIVDGIAVGFANAVPRGPVGIVGASGTGVQELSCLLGSVGIGISHAIGVGGRDLADGVDGLMTLRALEVLEEDAETTVVTIISKPPHRKVAERVARAASAMSKPAILCLLGESDKQLRGVTAVGTIEACAAAIADLIGQHPKTGEARDISVTPGFIRGLFSGGTLCGEAVVTASAHTGAKLFSNLDVPGAARLEDPNSSREHSFLDLGDEAFTEGRLHPMLDPTVRIERLRREAHDASVGVLLMDVVLGHAAHPDPAGAFAPIVRELLVDRRGELTVIVALCGMTADPQDFVKQRRILEEAGAVVCLGSGFATRLALVAAGLLPGPARGYFETSGPMSPWASPPSATGATRRQHVFGEPPKVINVGLQLLGRSLEEQSAEVTYVERRRTPMAHTELLNSLAPLASQIAAANDEAVACMQSAHPYLVGLGIAGDLLDGMDRSTFLHAGPPIDWDDMCGPMRGAIMGAAVLEGLADDPEEAKRKAAAGSFRFVPCHERGAVGPMAGVVSASMPMWIVANEPHGNRAFSTFNEGLGRVLRYGAFDRDVLDRLHWMRKVVYPTLRSALSSLDEPLDVRSLIAQALQMGDECHNRNKAGTSLLLRSVLPTLLCLEQEPRSNVIDVARFITDNDHFFLNLSMAASKAIADTASGIAHSSVVVAMARNGTEFGIRLAGTGDEWFTGPAGEIKGLYLPGFSAADANPDIGDSTITETVGLGGCAMAAAPAIIGFVGGTPEDATRATQDMYDITWSESDHFRIPALGFRGTPFGIDTREVVHTQVLPLINTGIAHKQPGIGQVGAGLVHPPIEAFTAALGHLTKLIR